MIKLLQIACIMLLYFFLFYTSGSVASRLCPTREVSFYRTVILGFFVYHFLFSIVALPMKVTLQPLSTLTAVWAVILIIITVLFFVTGRKDWRTRFDAYCKAFEGPQKYVTLAFFTLIIIQVVVVNLNDETYAIWDQSYYLGDTATSLYTNTISQYNPYTGWILDYLNPEYLLETYQNHSSVMCQMLHVHPMIENLTIMASVVVILYQMIFFEIGLFLFKGNRAKSVLLVGFMFLLNYFSFNLFTAAEFLMIRPSEGKTILAVLVIPALLYFFLRTLENPLDKTYWIHSFFVILGSFGLNMSAVFMIPFEISAFYIPLAIHKRRFSIIIRYVILLLPCIAVAAMYIMTKETHLIYTAQ